MGDKSKPVGLFDCLHCAWIQSDDSSSLDTNFRQRDVALVGVRVAILSLPVLISIGIVHILLLSSSPEKHLGISVVVLVLFSFLIGLDALAKRMQPLSESLCMVVASMWALAGCAARSQFSSIEGLSWGVTFCAPQLAITLLRLPCRTSHAVLLAHVVADTAIAMAGISFLDDGDTAGASSGGKGVAVNVMANAIVFGMCIFESYSFEVTMRVADKASDAHSADGGNNSELFLLVDRLLAESCDCIVYTDATVTMNVLRGTDELEDLFGQNVSGQPLLILLSEVKHSLKLVAYVKTILENVVGRTTPYMLPDPYMEVSFHHSSGTTFQTGLRAIWLPPHNSREACLAIGFRQKFTSQQASGDAARSFPRKEPAQLPISQSPRKASFECVNDFPSEHVARQSVELLVPTDSRETSRGPSAITSPASSVILLHPAMNMRQTIAENGGSASTKSSECTAKSGARSSASASAPPPVTPPGKLDPSLATSFPRAGQQQEQQDVFRLSQSGDRQPSVGSRGHPNNCAPPCKFVNGAKGCKDDEQCARCHLCKWKKTRAKAEKKEESTSQRSPTEHYHISDAEDERPPSPMIVSTPSFATSGGDQQTSMFVNHQPFMGAQTLPPGLSPHLQSRRDSTTSQPERERINSFVGTMVSGSVCSNMERRASGADTPAYITLQDTIEFPAPSNLGFEDQCGATTSMYRSLAQLGGPLSPARLTDPRLKKKNTFLHCDTSSVLSAKNRVCVSSASDPGVSGF